MRNAGLFCGWALMRYNPSKHHRCFVVVLLSCGRHWESCTLSHPAWFVTSWLLVSKRRFLWRHNKPACCEIFAPYQTNPQQVKHFGFREERSFWVKITGAEINCSEPKRFRPDEQRKRSSGCLPLPLRGACRKISGFKNCVAESWKTLSHRGFKFRGIT